MRVAVRRPFFVSRIEFCFQNARQSAPADGRDPSTNSYGQSICLTSKQNSDANGMFYQWGRKDPFTFATSSEQWGISWQRGEYPVKIYTIDGVLIYQQNDGSANKDKQPIGGVINSSIEATSMMGTIKNPITFYATNSAVVSQYGHTQDLWDYYWTSYSRGKDGYGFWGDYLENIINKHNDYLNGYKSQRFKSIYDPCPYGFRIPVNGVFNSFKDTGWISTDYASGITWSNGGNLTWMLLSGWKTSVFAFVGMQFNLFTATISSSLTQYGIAKIYNETIWNSVMNTHSGANSVRCIEFLFSQLSSVRPDRRA